MKTALITGVNGQDGHYLAKNLLDNDYKVIGVNRRTSNKQKDQDGVRIFECDVTDAGSLDAIVMKFKPDEIYHLAALSHVHYSFHNPVSTVVANITGTMNVLNEAHKTGARIYNAATSEMFGTEKSPQNENTPFHPRSPYAVSKVAGYWATVNYREAYNLFACNGICYNHECVSEHSPILVRKDGLINVVKFTEIVPLRRGGAAIQQFNPSGYEVWDGSGWTDIKAITATKRGAQKDHEVLAIKARGGIVSVTRHHEMIRSSGKSEVADNLLPLDNLLLAELMPNVVDVTSISDDFAEFLGYMVADGYVSKDGRAQFTKNDDNLRDRVADLWQALFMGKYRHREGVSGFSDNVVMQLYLSGCASALRWIREEIYTKEGKKRVPKIILNAGRDVQETFFDAYYACDGLKKGNSLSLKTNSAVLAQGLVYLVSLQGRDTSIYTEERNGKEYYAINIRKGGTSGQHWVKDSSEIRMIDESIIDHEWVFDLSTGSEKFMAGVGKVVVHNSPLRPVDFVTQKIVRAAVAIANGSKDKLVLGNLHARRDWGHASDYVDGMRLMLQQDNPDDYVLATGESHCVRDFARSAFNAVGLNWEDHTTTDPQFERPAEVPDLCGDPSKAEHVLGWNRKYSFDDLVSDMVNAELERSR